jgi:hypothetical protein
MELLPERSSVESARAWRIEVSLSISGSTVVLC